MGRRNRSHPVDPAAAKRTRGVMDGGTFLEINHEWVERMLDPVIERK